MKDEIAANTHKHTHKHTTPLGFGSAVTQYELRFECVDMLQVCKYLAARFIAGQRTRSYASKISWPDGVYISEAQRQKIESAFDSDLSKSIPIDLQECSMQFATTGQINFESQTTTKLFQTSSTHFTSKLRHVIDNPLNKTPNLVDRRKTAKQPKSKRYARPN